MFTKHFRYLHGGILTYRSCMDTAYGRENPPTKIAKHKVLVLSTLEAFGDMLSLEALKAEFLTVFLCVTVMF